MPESFWCDSVVIGIISLSPHLPSPFRPFSPSLISLMVSVDVKHNVYLLTVQTASVDIKPHIIIMQCSVFMHTLLHL